MTSEAEKWVDEMCEQMTYVVSVWVCLRKNRDARKCVFNMSIFRCQACLPPILENMGKTSYFLTLFKNFHYILCLFFPMCEIKSSVQALIPIALKGLTLAKLFASWILFFNAVNGLCFMGSQAFFERCWASAEASSARFVYILQTYVQTRIHMVWAHMCNPHAYLQTKKKKKTFLCVLK